MVGPTQQGVLTENIGPYRVLRQLGAGGMGAVFEAVHQNIGRRVAIKVLHPQFTHHPEFTARFFNEARAVNLVEHPGIVQISDYGQLPSGAAYLVMEFLKGESLAKRIRQTATPFPLAEALQIAWQLADSLAAAHAKKIVHRDLKPDNVMIVPDPHMPIGERTKLLDFGIAKLALEGSSIIKTRTDAVMGTPLYMSPEQCAGAGKVDARSDVYSLGCVLYQLLTGRPPFVAEGIGQILAMHLYSEPARVRESAPSIPAAIDELVHRLLSKDREQRPSMQLLSEELQSAISLAPPPLRRKSTGESQAERSEDSDLQSNVPSTLGLAASQRRIESFPRRWLGLWLGLALLLAGLATNAAIGWKRERAAATSTEVAANKSRTAGPPSLPKRVTLAIDSEPPGAEVIDGPNGSKRETMEPLAAPESTDDALKIPKSRRRHLASGGSSRRALLTDPPSKSTHVLPLED